ncbi:MAG: hypothetical protein MRY83_07225 [Flavobacteriales bacterium]|nr:hypothetical protein [Flavobacteriales bacterium]
MFSYEEVVIRKYKNDTITGYYLESNKELHDSQKHEAFIIKAQAQVEWIASDSETLAI